MAPRYSGLEKFAEARGYYERSAQIVQNATAYSNLGTTYYNDGRYADAAEQYEKATRQPDATSDPLELPGRRAVLGARVCATRPKWLTKPRCSDGERERQDKPKDTYPFLHDLADAHAVLGLLTRGSAAEQHRSDARTLLAATGASNRRKSRRISLRLRRHSRNSAIARRRSNGWRRPLKAGMSAHESRTLPVAAGPAERRSLLTTVSKVTHKEQTDGVLRKRVRLQDGRTHRLQGVSPR